MGFTVDLPAAEIVKRADAQHAARVAAMPTAGKEPDTDEADYDTLTEAKRLEFETKRRAHRRQVAVVEARIKASEIAHGHRLATLKEEHEAFLGRLEGVLSTYKGEAQDYEPPPPPAEGEEAEPEPIGLPGVWALDPLKPPPSPEEGEEGAGEEAVDVAEPEEEEAEKPDYLESVVAECLTHLRDDAASDPRKEPDPDIPIPYTKQILKRPRPRKPASAPPGLVSAHAAAASTASCRAGRRGGGRPAPAAEPAAEGEGEEAAEPPEPTEETRWVIPPHDKVYLQANYSSSLVGKLLHSLRFEVVGIGGSHGRPFACCASCARPSISTDPRNVFSRKVKSREPLRVKKSYVVSRKCFEFGPLLAGGRSRRRPRRGVRRRRSREAASRPRGAAAHLQQLALPAHRPLLLPRCGHRSAYAAASSVRAAASTAAAVAEGEEAVVTLPCAVREAEEELVPRPAGSPPVFFLDVNSMTLEPNETRDLRLSAYPDMDGLFEDNLVCTVTNNPEPVQFPISCVGSTPSVDLDATEIVFQRMLMGQHDTKVLPSPRDRPYQSSWKIR